jgi:RNA polymerase sigma factor (sigma-70 family)
MDHMRLGDLIPNQGTSPTQHAIKQGIKTAVDELLLELDEQEREVIIQRKLEGLTFGEMASETGKTEDAVRKQFNRSFQKLISLAETRHLLQELRL